MFMCYTMAQSMVYANVDMKKVKLEKNKEKCLARFMTIKCMQLLAILCSNVSISIPQGSDRNKNTQSAQPRPSYGERGPSILCPVR